MTAKPKIALFDCYGTLVDWEGGAASYLYCLAQRHDPEPALNGNAMRERWEAIQFEVIQGPYLPYKQVLAESLRLWAEEQGYPYTEADGEGLVRSMRSWGPFPDTRPALLQARANGMQLAILSNTDRDIIAHTLRHIDVPFEAVVTAEDCGSYKPSDNNFERALAVLGVAPEEILHVAFGFKYDIGPAQRHGLGTAWVNRHDEPRPGREQPDYMWRDLWGLAKFAGGPGPEAS